MTVVGSLEDLSFPDILQVIHVSRQSGTLVLSGPHGTRRVRFQNGLVCGATLGDGGPELEEILLQRRLIDARALGRARERRRMRGETISSALVALGAVSQEMVEGVVREELRSILRSLVLLQEGEFTFEVDGPTGGDLGRGIGIREGLGPDAILQGLPVRGRAHPPHQRQPSPSRDRRQRHVLLIVERSMLRYRLKDELVRKGFEVEAASSPDEGYGIARSWAADGTPFALVSDLMLPDRSGAGWRGGIDLVRRVGEIAPGVVAIVIGEVRDPSIAREARDAGATAYHTLPDLGDAGPEEVETRLDRFCTEVRDILEHPDRPVQRMSASEPLRVVDPLSLLRGLIGEMRAEEEAGIPLLVLRLAAEYFERGVLFAVRDGEACGAGAFGGSAGGVDDDGLDASIRGIALPLQRGSALQLAVQGRETYIGPIPHTRPNVPLLSHLGEPAPGESALLPLLSGRHVFGILYGDNARSGQRMGDLKALEIFLSQAGIALENAFLQRRIASLARRRDPVGRGGRGSSTHA